MTESDKLDKILDHLECHGRDIADIKRGVYGDPVNKQPGLVDRQIQDEKRIAAIEESQTKRKYWLAGAAAVVTVVINGLVFFFKEIFSK